MLFLPIVPMSQTPPNAPVLLPTDQDAETIVRSAMKIAAEICVYTNSSLVIESIERR
jgi:ATP-dependent protease HslVU (ClpYQ) peptidase subunit